MKKTVLVLVFFLLMLGPVFADPNCPPQYQNVCRQLVQFLESHKNGYFYTWDGTHLYVGANFNTYDYITKNPNSPKKTYDFPGLDYYKYIAPYKHDFFPVLLNEMVARTQNGQQAYLHLYSFLTHQYTTGKISQTLPSKIHQNTGPGKKGPTLGVAPGSQPPLPKSPTNVPSTPPHNIGKQTTTNKNRPAAILNTTGKPPQTLQSKIHQNTGPGKKGPTLGVAPGSQTPVHQSPTNLTSTPPHNIGKKTTTNKNRPAAISIQSAKKNFSDKQVDKSNVNDHFITSIPGSHIDQNERSYMVDSDGKVWSCKISGMGARQMTDQEGNKTFLGHVETLHFQSRHILHIPANHEPECGCLISVHK